MIVGDRAAFTGHRYQYLHTCSGGVFYRGDTVTLLMFCWFMLFIRWNYGTVTITCHSGDSIPFWLFFVMTVILFYIVVVGDAVISLLFGILHSWWSDILPVGDLLMLMEVFCILCWWWRCDGDMWNERWCLFLWWCCWKWCHYLCINILMMICLIHHILHAGDTTVKCWVLFWELFVLDLVVSTITILHCRLLFTCFHFRYSFMILLHLFWYILMMYIYLLFTFHAFIYCDILNSIYTFWYIWYDAMRHCLLVFVHSACSTSPFWPTFRYFLLTWHGSALFYDDVDTLLFILFIPLPGSTDDLLLPLWALIPFHSCILPVPWLPFYSLRYSATPALHLPLLFSMVVIRYCWTTCHYRRYYITYAAITLLYIRASCCLHLMVTAGTLQLFHSAGILAAVFVSLFLLFPRIAIILYVNHSCFIPGLCCLSAFFCSRAVIQMHFLETRCVHSLGDIFPSFCWCILMFCLLFVAFCCRYCSTHCLPYSAMRCWVPTVHSS